MTVLELTAEGSRWLRNPNRDALELTKPAVAKSEKAPRVRKSKAGEIECDEALFEQLRQLCRTMADERDVPPYIIFSDVALRHMAHDYPVTPAKFGLINGVGEKKLAEFGEIFTGAIAAFLEENPRREFKPAD
jgi:ATP-dependent DNA helicase RecQ